MAKNGRFAAHGRGSPISKRLTLLVFSLAVAFAVGELATRLYLGYGAPQDRFLAYASFDQLDSRPDLQRRLSAHRYLGIVTSSGYRSGRNRHSSLGFRGGELAIPKPPEVYRIVCLGGSTTYSTAVEDPADAYPALLERALHAAGYSRVEVVNAGVPGYSTLESLISLELRILDLDPDLIVVHHGINDIHLRLVWPPSAYRGDGSGARDIAVAREMPSILEHSSLLRAVLVRLGRIAAHSSLERMFGSGPPSAYAAAFHLQILDDSYPDDFFRQVSVAEMLDANPPLFFERNLRNLVALARFNDIEVSLLTFPYDPAWRGRSPIAYPAYRSGLAEQNLVVRRVVETSAAEGFDLAAVMPAGTHYYVDGYHSTLAGNQERARLLAEFLVAGGTLESAASKSGS